MLSFMQRVKDYFIQAQTPEYSVLEAIGAVLLGVSHSLSLSQRVRRMIETNFSQAERITDIPTEEWTQTSRKMREREKKNMARRRSAITINLIEEEELEEEEEEEEIDIALSQNTTDHSQVKTVLVEKARRIASLRHLEFQPYEYLVVMLTSLNMYSRVKREKAIERLTEYRQRLEREYRDMVKQFEKEKVESKESSPIQMENHILSYETYPKNIKTVLQKVGLSLSLSLSISLYHFLCVLSLTVPPSLALVGPLTLSP